MPKIRKSEYKIVKPSYSMSYTLSPDGYGYERPKQPFFSLVELRDIAIAVTALTIAFFIVLYPRDGSVLYYAVLAALSVIVGFFIHEMSHKVVARGYGCWAEFRADIRGLGLALLMSFFGFLFAAPGAVWIAGNVSRDQNGRISLAGPGSNLIVAAALLPLAFGLVSGLPDVVHGIAFSLYFFNVFLAAFNMIPIMPFDGAKILRWSIPIYAGTLALAGCLFVLAWL